MAVSEDVLVIGGTGLMGAPTVQKLQAQGHRVTILSRGLEQGMGTAGQRPKRPECDMIQCDRTEEGALLAELLRDTCPRIIVDFTAMQPHDIQQIIAAHRQKALQHYIFISTNMVYPGGPENMDVSGQVLTEDQAQLELAEEAPDTYGGKKLKCEALLQQALASHGLCYTALRPPAVVGPGCDNRHERLQRLVQGLPPLSPRKGKQVPAKAHGAPFRVAYSGDVAAAVAAVVLKGQALKGEALNIASGESVTMEDYVQEMAELLGYEKPELPPPAEDAAVWNYEKQGQVNITKAEKLLAFRPSQLRDWLSETVKWHEPLLVSTPAKRQKT